MQDINPQSIALAVAALYTFGKYAVLTSSYASPNSVAVRTGRVSRLRPYIWTILPVIMVSWVAIASVYDLQCKANVAHSAVAVWVVITFLPLGIARVSVLTSAFASLSAGVALWATVTDTPCLFLSITAMLSGAVTILAYARISRLFELSFTAAMTGPKRALAWAKDAMEKFR